MFTYCLVTKGRREYLQSTLDSLKTVLERKDVNVIVVDNGCPADISIALKRWCDDMGARAHYLRFEENQSAAPRIWAALRKFDIDWISFPGDDDVVEPAILNSLRTQISINPKLIAMAGSMRILDSSGKHTGETRNPTEFRGDALNYLSLALSEPPFLFPALFFKLSSITAHLPPSRYVFDWWLALNLICIGDFLTTNEVAINYRVHAGQESFLAPNRRKYFEAQIVISRFLNSPEFKGKLEKFSDKDLAKLWENVKMNPPIYRDQEFGDYIKTALALNVASITKNNNLENIILGDLALSRGVLLRKDEVRSFKTELEEVRLENNANFQLKLADQNCSKLSSLIGGSEADYPREKSFIIGCSHSKKAFDFFVDCKLESDESNSWLDRLIVAITLDLEKNGELNFKISPREIMILGLARKIKEITPFRIKSAVKRLALSKERI